MHSYTLHMDREPLLPATTKLVTKVILFGTSVCQVHRERRGDLPQCMLGYNPPASIEPPREQTPPEQTPPGAWHPPPGGHKPLPQEADSSFTVNEWPMYASYWNALLVFYCAHHCPGPGPVQYGFRAITSLAISGVSKEQATALKQYRALHQPVLHTTCKNRLPCQLMVLFGKLQR